jgi:hypothetical protein
LVESASFIVEAVLIGLWGAELDVASCSLTIWSTGRELPAIEPFSLPSVFSRAMLGCPATKCLQFRFCLRSRGDWSFRRRGNVGGIAQCGSVLVSVPIAGSRLEGSQQDTIGRTMCDHMCNERLEAASIACTASSRRMQSGS